MLILEVEWHGTLIAENGKPANFAFRFSRAQPPIIVALRETFGSTRFESEFFSPSDF